VMDVDSSKMNAQPLRAEDETEKVLVRDTGYVVLERRGLPSDVEGVVTSAGELFALESLRRMELRRRPQTRTPTRSGRLSTH
jgi:hypothetical protein